MLDDLRRALPPPKRPIDHHGDWAGIESSIGMGLPSDYKAFISLYGGGQIGKCLVVSSPFLWVRHGRDVREAWANWASFYPDIAVYGEVIPYPVFPQPGGLLPFGNLGDVNILNWLTVGEPDCWPFVYYDRDDGFIEVKGLSAVGFILEAVTQRSPLMIRTNSESVFDPPCTFEPDTADPRFVQMVSPRPLDIQQLAGLFASRWPVEQVRVRSKSERVQLLVEPLEGSILLSQEGSDERRWLNLNYDGAHEGVAAEVIHQAIGMGFTVLARSHAEPDVSH